MDFGLVKQLALAGQIRSVTGRGGKGSGLFITHDGGDHWKQITQQDGLPEGELGRIGLAIAPSDTQRVYALIEAKKNGFYRSDDGGLHWKLVNEEEEIGNRPFYYSDIRVDPQNENRIYLQNDNNKGEIPL